ncbi:DNase I-like protein [Cutaneotrichosporon oleaginosum]|uniref:DNase I-like protein n=1 Tax=Cutaneotrichosporon oleaginosum TaxID=879819 RepID=A0A0J0XQG4_9TREE|nr:DNase I-like protein [Cutaneotrichosporon oleaginosum]KLT43327.1 DNase I-like protein [Cutaneotrichosporon oleaginosum]TXT14411.1 hypothetical protein COLE_00604 [Cutaneotrichosporon oleaginosum]
MRGAHTPQPPPALGLHTSGPAPPPSAAPMPIPPRARRRSFSNMVGSPGSPRRSSTLLSASPSEQTGILRRRFSSMFTSEGEPGSPRQFALDPDIPEREPEPFKDRNAIKVKIITWNMADSVPKGDLSVLLGDIPASAYDIPARGDELPELPIEDAHPYHIVVFAAQECPSASGMPRGLGGSLMKGVGLQKSEAARREREDKKEEQEEKRRQDKEAEKEARKAIREIRKEFLDRSANAAAERDAVQALKELRKEYKEREGPAASLKDLIDKDKDTKEKEKNIKAPGLGISLSGLTEDLLEKSKAIVSPGYVSDSDSLRLAAQPNGDPAPETAGILTSVGPSAADRSITAADPVSSSEGGANTPALSIDSSTGDGCVSSAPAAAAAPLPSVMSPSDVDPLVALPPSNVEGTKDASVATSSGDSAPHSSDPPKPKAVQELKELDGEQALLPATPGQQVKEKPSREQLRIDPLYKRKVEPKDAAIAARSHTAFDIGLGSPMSDLAGAIGRKGWSGMLEVPVANGTLEVPSAPFGRSLSGNSFQSVDTSTSSFFVQQEDRPFGRSPSVREMGRSPGIFDSPITDEVPVKRFFRQPGAGAYVHLIKERLMGLYVHVFVYKGCEHLVEGVDKDFVRTGLAGGRIGNKGGIGISLNLKGHRLLFVNAHLAAHTECNDDRIANINKIKSELKPNCFLAPDDPRVAMPDVTDRFDTTFWCGDLNFRVDITPLHAKWLLKEQRYIAEAQEWDQLKNIMKDKEKTPLRGFEEAEIKFMPTFKYDIWKSVSATNRDKRRSIRRARRSSDQSTRPSMERPSSPRLDGVPEIDVVEESSSAPESPEIPHSVLLGQPVMSPVPETPPLSELPLPDELSIVNHSAEQYSNGLPDRSRDPTIADASRKSTATYRSERSDRASESTNGHSPSPWEISSMTPTSQDQRRLSGGWSRGTTRSATKDLVGATVDVTKRSGHTLKAKTQKLMSIIRLGRKPALRPLPPAMPDDSSRRSSVASSRSRGVSEGRLSILSDDPPQPPGPIASSPLMGRASLDPDITPTQPGLVLPDGEAVHRTPSSQSVYSVSGRRLASPPRRPRTLIRSLSGRDLTEEADEEEPNDLVDTRTGVYDSSKKGRIPSWCDRVLWKTHVIPDIVEDLVDDDDESVASNGPLMRLSNVFSSLSERMRRRSSFYGDAETPRTSFPRIVNSVSAPHGLVASVPPDQHHSPEQTVAPDQRGPPEPTARDQLVVPEQTTPIVPDEHVFESDPPTPAESEPPFHDSPELLTNSVLPNGQASPLPAHIRSLSSARKRGRSVTFEHPAPLSLALRRDLSPTAEVPSTPTPLEKPISIGLGPSPQLHRRASSSTESTPSRRQSLARRLSMSSIGSMGSASSRRRRSEDVSFLRTGSPQLHPLKAVRSTGQVGEARSRMHRNSDGGLSVGDAPQSGLNALTRFFRGLPGRFHSRVSLFHGSEAEAEEPTPEAPRRHLVGEVQVLHYGTLEDVDMRRLEGRSDHYPLIFSAAIYV